MVLVGYHDAKSTKNLPTPLERHWGDCEDQRVAGESLPGKAHSLKKATLRNPKSTVSLVPSALWRGAFSSDAPEAFLHAIKDTYHIPQQRFAIIWLDHNDQLHHDSSDATLLPKLFTAEVNETFLSHHRSKAAASKKSTKEVKRLPTACRAPSTPDPRKARSSKPKDPAEQATRVPRSRSMYTPESEDEDDDEDIMPASTVGVNLRLDDDAALGNFYQTRFRQMQQVPCKTLAKAWIKIVHPQKQAKYPYNGGKLAKAANQAKNGELTRPPWWPEGVPHTEPDHITKEPRVALLHCILRGIQRQEWHKPVAELELGTKTMFANASEAKLRCWLDDVYRVRRAEESYLRGERDGSSTESVTMPGPPRRASRARLHKHTVTEDRSASSSVSSPHDMTDAPTAKRRKASPLPGTISAPGMYRRPGESYEDSGAYLPECLISDGVPASFMNHSLFVTSSFSEHRSLALARESAARTKAESGAAPGGFPNLPSVSTGPGYLPNLVNGPLLVHHQITPPPSAGCGQAFQPLEKPSAQPSFTSTAADWDDHRDWESPYHESPWQMIPEPPVMH